MMMTDHLVVTEYSIIRCNYDPFILITNTSGAEHINHKDGIQTYCFSCSGRIITQCPTGPTESLMLIWEQTQQVTLVWFST
jgi:hypothetical protein